MSAFPQMVFDDSGLWGTFTDDKRYKYGTLMVTLDGRSFRYAEVGGTQIAAGRVVQTTLVDAAFDELVTAAAAVGSRTINITTGATAIDADEFNEGYVNVEDDAGEGHLYLIEDTPAIATTTAGNLTIAPPGVRVALTAATTCGLEHHPFRNVIIQPSPPTAVALGVTPTTATADDFGWIQTKGHASVLTDGTIVIAASVMPSNGVDGAVEAWGLTEGTPNVEITPVCGWVVAVAATTEHSVIQLMFE